MCHPRAPVLQSKFSKLRKSSCLIIRSPYASLSTISYPLFIGSRPSTLDFQLSLLGSAPLSLRGSILLYLSDPHISDFNPAPSSPSTLAFDLPTSLPHHLR